MGYDKDRFLELCTLASEEQNHSRLIKLLRELCAILDTKEKRHICYSMPAQLVEALDGGTVQNATVHA